MAPVCEWCVFSEALATSPAHTFDLNSLDCFDMKFIFFLFPLIFCCLLMRKNWKIKENIRQLTDGESPSAPIGLFLERDEGWRKRRRGTRIKRLKNG